MSVNGFMLRSLDSTNEWQVVFGRNLCFAPMMGALLWIRYRKQLLYLIRDMGWIGIGAGICLGLANTTVIVAMTHTTIANALLTLSACPLITAVLARIFLREPISHGTVLAIAVAMFGIAIMVADGLATGSPFGNLIAFLCAIFFSMFVICLRCGKNRNMLPASMIGGLIGMAIGLGGANFDFALSTHDFIIYFIWGGIITSIVHFLFVLGSRYVLGAEIMLITLIEFILGPVWVWLAFGEQPTRTALLGGSLVLSAVAGRSIVLIKQRGTRAQNAE
jgi:drug/metabolite transporter (DMT)-like permease